MATAIYPYTQYGGIWNLNSQVGAKGAGTWPVAGPKLYAWGWNSYGQLGLGNTTNYSSPKQVGALANWSSVTSGYGNTFAVTTGGILESWGFGNQGILGLGNINIQYSSPKQVGALTNWSKNISIGSATSPFALATKTDGTLWAWGNNSYGQLGLNTASATIYSSPVQVGALTNWSNVSTGFHHVTAIKTNGTLWSWGYNTYGELGLGNTTNYSSPKQVGALTNWLNVSAGVYLTLATKTDGTLWAWGNGGSGGQLGFGNLNNYSSPKQVGALTNWLSVISGNYCSFAVKTNNTLWSWGNNGGGQLGLGNTTNYSSPKQVGALTNWSIVSVNFFSYSVSSIKTDGTLWSWGRNDKGQLGLGDTTNQIFSISSWIIIILDFYFCWAIYNSCYIKLIFFKGALNVKSLCPYR
jgi:alpha-tubulin suppressor-like RCC1 family protein